MASVGFCSRCGKKLDFTADEIAGALVREAREETAANTLHYAKQALTFGGAFFLLAATLFALSRGAPTESYTIPAVSPGSKHVDLEFKGDPRLERLAIPIEFRKR
jgi:hypothetical protein